MTLEVPSVRDQDADDDIARDRAHKGMRRREEEGDFSKGDSESEVPATRQESPKAVNKNFKLRRELGEVISFYSFGKERNLRERV